MGVLVEICGLSTASRRVNPIQHSIIYVQTKEQGTGGRGLMGVLVELCYLSTASRRVNPIQHSITYCMYKKLRRNKKLREAHKEAL